MKYIEFSICQGIKSAQSEQSSKKYKKIKGKSADWYIAIQKNEGDNIYFASRSKSHSNGFGGSSLQFELEDGTIDTVQGPWHSNSASLLEDTGYDATHKYLTQGIIALDCEPHSNKNGVTLHKEILHRDEEPVLGDYHRIDIMAQEFANKLQKEVYCAVVSMGGGSSGWKKPVAYYKEEKDK